MKFWNVAIALFVFATTNLAVYRRDWNEKLVARSAKSTSFESGDDRTKFKKFKKGE